MSESLWNEVFQAAKGCDKIQKKINFFKHLESYDHTVLSFIIDKSYLARPDQRLKKELKSKNNDNDFSKLLELIDLEQEEQEWLQVHAEERASDVFIIFHLVITTILGLTSGILGFFTISDSKLVHTFLVLAVLCLLPVASLIKINWKDLRRRAEDSILTIKIAKFREEVLLIIRRKLQNELRNNFQKIKATLNQAPFNIIINEKSDRMESKTKSSASLSLNNNLLNSEDLKKLEALITPVISGFSQKDPNNVLQNLKELQRQLQVEEANGTYDELNQLLEAKEPVINYRESIRGARQSDENQLTVKEWWQKHKRSLIWTGVSTFLGTSAGNFFFPMLIIKLGGTKLESIHTLGINQAADFVKSERGLSITLAIVLFGGLLFTCAALIKQFRGAARNFYPEKFQEYLTTEQLKNEKLRNWNEATLKTLHDLYQIQITRFSNLPSSNFQKEKDNAGGALLPVF